jgi:hypothetical protein
MVVMTNLLQLAVSEQINREIAQLLLYIEN